MTKYLDYINIDYYKEEILTNRIQGVIPREPTEEEKIQIREYFPNINMESVIIIRDSSSVYNAIAWSLGIDYTWINPPYNLSEFKTFYETVAESMHPNEFGEPWQTNHNWESLTALDPDGEIDGWGYPSTTEDPSMTHASCLLIKNDYSPQGIWTSKLGSGYAIVHDRNGLRNENYYGETLVSFKTIATDIKPIITDIEILDNIKTSHLEVTKSTFFSIQEQEILYKKLDILKLEEIGEKFSIAYQNWIDAIYEKIPFSSDTRDGAKLEEFKPLLDMGADILPIVVFLIISNPSKNFRALVLYDALQKDNKLEIKYTPNDPNQLEGEISRAARTAKLWLRNELLQ